MKNKVALVTGAARGIGRAIADALAANGARVVYTDVDEAELTAAASARLPACASTADRPSGGQSQRNGAAMVMNVTDEAQVNAVIARVQSEMGRLDILVNNAGVNTMKHRVTIDQFPLEEWERILRVDLTGLFLVSRAASRPMIAQHTGRIINISSVLGLTPARLQCAFTAAKAGVINLTRAMALELAPHGILVNCVAPGSTLTEATQQLFYSDDALMQERAQRMLAHVPLGRPGTVAEIAHAVLFFAAPGSSYITGQTLCVDGGWSAGGFMRDF